MVRYSTVICALLGIAVGVIVDVFLLSEIGSQLPPLIYVISPLIFGVWGACIGWSYQGK
ncbi:hypothetical protein ES703_36782 [subsurface metagenome]